MMSTRKRSPFTPIQWQELQEQALVYKYIASGVPIPPELIYSVQGSLHSSLASRLLPNQLIGWNSFQVGFDRKVDLEPGRCRRTDGKKWRCSKEAYPDSKYCEKHMHRGKNRSRKPGEVASSTISSTKTTPPPSFFPPHIPSSKTNLTISTNSTIHSISPFTLSPLPSSSLASEIYNSPNPSQETHFNSYLQNSHSSSSKPPDYGLTLQNQSSHHFLDSRTGISYPQANTDYRHFSGTKEGVDDERVFFPEAAESSYKNLSQSQYQSFIDSSNQQQQEQHCLVLGTDISSATTMKKERENQKPVHHFFENWSPNNNTDSWLDLAFKSRVRTDS
ncbi:hypothetical protein SLEP1_g21284 [Rubroshorea leprosula]|uniref:Growth-regulating factor n=1 Tax=Rubroshorea leprosula TaxID=152421 RepID=A0AAV5J5E9_9ROSI|nr:hypothetical protein SLEP1_g21284 [Rubroshorea leprosula]